MSRPSLPVLPLQVGETGDILLRTAIGLVLVTALIWLAAVAAGKIGERFSPKNGENSEENNEVNQSEGDK